MSLNLADGATAAASVWGNLVADRERSGAADVDVLWVGALTPDAVLKVKVEGTSERATGIFNRAAVELHPHLPRTTGEQPAVKPAAPADADGFVTYRQRRLRQLLPQSNRRHGGAGPLPAELDVPRVVENRKSELGGQDGDLNRVGQQVLAAKLRIVEDRGQKVLPYQVEKAIPKEVGLVLRAEAIHAVNLVNRSRYLRSFVLRYALHREEQLLGQAQLGFLEIDTLHQFVHGIVARRCQLPVQLAIDNGEQCFNHDRRPDNRTPARWEGECW